MENYPQLSFNYNVADKSDQNISVFTLNFFLVCYRIETRMNVVVSFYLEHDVVNINRKKLKTCQKKLDLTLFALFQIKNRNSFDAIKRKKYGAFRIDDQRSTSTRKEIIHG